MPIYHLWEDLKVFSVIFRGHLSVQSPVERNPKLKIAYNAATYVDSIAVSLFVDILVELTNIRRQDPNNYPDAETMCLVYCYHNPELLKKKILVTSM